MSRSSWFAALAAALLGCASAARATEPSAKPNQVVIISFDGAHDLAQWHRSRELASKTGAHFTYFLSCVFLLSPETKATYQPPGKSAGRSNVGFAMSKAEIAARLQQLWLAYLGGHEIASHGCGHFDGKDWSVAQWKQEFASFQTILRDAWKTNKLAGEPKGWQRFATTEVEGFRAPYLSTGKNLTRAMQSASLRYSASGVSQGPAAPAKKLGVLQFALPQIPEGPSARPVIAMDYNLFVRHSGGFEREDKGALFEGRALAAFKAAFDKQYDGERVPFQLGFHFVLMNGGAYWRALERFAVDVCGRADVDCISYADYVARLDAAGKTAATPIGG